MDRRTRQRERMRRYFIDAAKQIIKEQGLEGVSARNVADLAGYSYATIYNYFSDLNDLLWHVTLDLIDEMAELLGKIPLQGDDPIGWLKQGYHAYMRYYLERPAVFRFLLHSQIGTPSAEVAKQMNMNQIGSKQQVVLQACIQRGLLSSQDAPLVAQMLVTLTHGLLLMHFASQPQISAEGMFQAIDMYIDFVFARLTAPSRQ